MTVQSVTLVGKLNDPLFQKAKKSAEVRGHEPYPPYLICALAIHLSQLGLWA
jgi:hypothetical protein